MVKICIVHYNTPKLTECLIRSINKYTPNSCIYIFDNSDKEPFTYRQDNIIYFDNTKGQIINFDEWLKKFPNKSKSSFKLNNYASARHCYSVEKCFDLINDNFILLDSDVLLKQDISSLYDDNYIFIGEVHRRKDTVRNVYWEPRLLPFISFINVKKCKQLGIHFLYENKMCGLHENDYYDTGSAFYLESKKYAHKQISYKSYIIHFQQGSWNRKGASAEDWLNRNKIFWNGLKSISTINMSPEEKEIIAFGKTRNININLQNPVTIQDKINWLKIHDNTPLKTRCADKILLHDYCVEKLGQDMCIPIIKVYNNADEINWDELPNSFAIKCNHGSGMNIIVKDKATLDKDLAIKKLKNWLKIDFSKVAGSELQYKNIKRKIFVEEYKSDSEQKNSLTDYKFWCFNGVPKFIHVVDDRYSGKMHFNFYDTKFNKMDLEQTNHPVSDHLIPAPKNLNKMIEYAKILSKDFIFARIDFYEINEKLYLGEITFTPDSGMFKYKNPEDNIRIGNMLDISKDEKIIVTMTTWEDRICNVPAVLDTILSQNKMPNKIVINLSKEEFVSYDNLPQDFKNYVEKHELIEINWIEGKNIKQWKKIIPTLFKYPKDCVICIDDDRKYPKNFIEALWNTHLKHPDSPITHNKVYKLKGKYLQHAGHGTLDKLEYYDGFKDIDLNDMYRFSSSDSFFTLIANNSGHPILPYEGVMGAISMYNEVSPLKKSQNTYSTASHVEMYNYLLNNKIIDIKNLEKKSSPVIKKTLSEIASRSSSRSSIASPLIDSMLIQNRNRHISKMPTMK